MGLGGRGDREMGSRNSGQAGRGEIFATSRSRVVARAEGCVHHQEGSEGRWWDGDHPRVRHEPHRHRGRRDVHLLDRHGWIHQEHPEMTATLGAPWNYVRPPNSMSAGARDDGKALVESSGDSRSRPRSEAAEARGVRDRRDSRATSATGSPPPTAESSSPLVSPSLGRTCVGVHDPLVGNEDIDGLLLTAAGAD